jgi:hypothetical protein
MFVKFPVTLVDGTVIEAGDQPFWYVLSQKTNGIDADGNRITNIMGYDGVCIVKWCPRCGQLLPNLDFGYDGDQAKESSAAVSFCDSCRGEN